MYITWRNQPGESVRLMRLKGRVRRVCVGFLVLGRLYWLNRSIAGPQDWHLALVGLGDSTGGGLPETMVSVRANPRLTSADVSEPRRQG
jgi:hypothetical protein